MDYLKIIKLGKGKGVPGKQACWMTALNTHLGGEWTDQCECVDPLINRLCIAINDLSHNDLRTKEIMEFGLFRPLYTKGTSEDTRRRFLKYYDVLYRKWIPLALKNLNINHDFVSYLEQLQPINALSDVKTITEHSEAVGFQQWLSGVIATKYLDEYQVLKWVKYVLDLSAIFATCILSLNCGLKILSSVPNKIKLMYELLNELILTGPHAPDEPTLPACGISKFLELVGAK